MTNETMEPEISDAFSQCDHCGVNFPGVGTDCGVCPLDDGCEASCEAIEASERALGA